MNEEPFGALLKIKVIKNKVIKKGKNDEEGDMEDGDSDGDIHSDGGTDRTGNNLVHGLRTVLILTQRRRFFSHREAGFSHTETQSYTEYGTEDILRVTFRVLRVKNSVIRNATLS